MTRTTAILLILALAAGVLWIFAGTDENRPSRSGSSRPPAADSADKNIALARQHEAKGDSFLRAEELDEALKEYTRAIELNPAAWSTYLARGQVYARQERIALAAKDFERVIALNPMPEAYVMHAAMVASLGDIDGALADYAEAIRRNPSYPLTYHMRAITYAQRGQFDLAEADSAEAIRLAPDNSLLQHGHGEILHRAGKADAARRQWRKACGSASRGQVKNWQYRLAEVKRYDGPISGQCDKTLIDAFAACAKDQCYF